jgi:hypothetical protein
MMVVKGVLHGREMCEVIISFLPSSACDETDVNTTSDG